MSTRLTAGFFILFRNKDFILLKRSVVCMFMCGVFLTMNEPDIHEIGLVNGIRLLYVSTSGNVSHVQIDVLTGSDHEIDATMYESAHFLEHMNAQLTSSLESNSRKLATDLETLGVVWNAFTTPHRTAYFLMGPRTTFDRMLDVLVSTFFDFKMDTRVFLQEKRAVEQELKRIQNGQWYPLLKTRLELLYPNHPRSASIEDRLKSVKNLTIEDLMKFRKTFYVTQNITVTLVHGTRGRSNILRRLSERISVVPHSFRDPPSFPLLRIGEKTGHVSLAYLNRPNVSSSKILITFRVPFGYFEDSQKYSMLAISMLLTGGFSSRLFHRLRTIEGLVYSVSSDPYLDPYDRNASTFTISTSTNNENAGKAILIILEETLHMGQGASISDAEYKKYRNRMRFRFDERRLNNHPQKWASIYTESTVWHQAIVKEEDHRRNALRITKEQIQTVASRVFSPQGEIIVLYGGPIDFNETIHKALMDKNQLSTSREIT